MSESWDFSLAGGWLAWASWTWIQVWALLRLQPVWGRLLGMSWWFISAGMAAALTLCMSCQSPLVAPAWPGMQIWFTQALVAFGLGSLWGLVVALPTYALVGAASEIRARVVGEQGSDAMLHLIMALSLVLGIGLGVHRPLLLALSDGSFASPLDLWRDRAALASTDGVAAGAQTVEIEFALLFSRTLHAARDAMTLSLALATPVLLAMALVDTLVSALTSAFAPVPAATKAAAAWLRLSVALLALGASWSTYPQAWSRGWA